MKTLTISGTRSNGVEAATPQSPFSADTDAADEYSPEDLERIATTDTLLGYSAAVMIPLGFFLIPFASRPFAIAVLLGLHVFTMKLACQLARLMHKSIWLWAGWTGIPVINLLAFIRITSQAVVILRRNGIRCAPLGLGVSRGEMQRFGSPNENSPTEIWKSPHNS